MNAVLFFLLAGFWGGSFIAIKVIVESVPPVLGATFRVFFSTIILTAIYTIQKKPFAIPATYRLKSGIAGILSMGLPFSLLFWAERIVSPGLAGIINGTVPIWTFVISMAFISHLEAFTIRKTMGLALGIAGICCIFLPKLSFGKQSTDLIGSLAVLLMAISYGSAIAMNRNLMAGKSNINVYANLYHQHLTSLIYLIPATFFFEGIPDLARVFTTPKVFGAVLYLSLFSTALGNLVFYYLIREWGALKASAVTYVVPIMALLLDFIIYGNVPRVNELTGVCLVFAAIAVLQLPKSVLMKRSAALNVTLVLFLSGYLASCTRKMPDTFGLYSQNVDTLASGIVGPKELIYHNDQYYVFSQVNPDGSEQISKWTRAKRVEPVVTGLSNLGAITTDARRYQLYASVGNEVRIYKLSNPKDPVTITTLNSSPFDRLTFSIINRKAYAVRSAENEVWEIDPVKKSAKVLIEGKSFEKWAPAKLDFIRPSVDGTLLYVATKEPAYLLKVSIKEKTADQIAKLPEDYSPLGMGYYRFRFVFMDRATSKILPVNYINGATTGITAKEIPELHPAAFAMDMNYVLALDLPPESSSARLLRFPISIKEK